MKHLTKQITKLALLALTAMLPQLASAYDFKVDELCYNYNSDGTSVTVTSGGNYTGAINIPESVSYYGTTYSVTTIGYGAFKDCSGLTSVAIPNSVTEIGDEAFGFCYNLTSLTIPNSVTTIGDGAFRSCSGLTSVTIPNSVTWLGSQAFFYCEGLTSVTISNSLNTINNWTFEHCSQLTSVEIPSSILFIHENAFAETGLTSVTIPKDISSIHPTAFSACDNLQSMIVESENPRYDSRNNCNAIIETATNTLIAGCKNTLIPNSVTVIGNSAFMNCRSLTSVNIPSSVTKIGEYAFINQWYQGGMISLTIPNSVTTIGYGAFIGCKDLTSVTLTGNGTWNTLSNMPFINKTLNIGREITSLGDFGFNPEIVNCYAETPPTCSSGTFSNYDGELHVPTTSVASYFTTEYWQNFNNLVNDLTERVTLDKTSANLVLWETLALTSTVVPEGSEVLWSSSNPSVAIVDENGIVTATGEGECDIYATLASNPAVYAWCHISVSYPEISLSLSEESLNINIGEEQTITCSIIPDNTGLTPTWSSSNTSVATVDANGKVTAVGEGECDITVTILDKTATCHVTVTNNVIITLNIDKAIVGANQMLTVYPSCAPDVPVELVVTSSDPSVAVARVINRTNAPAAGLMQFAEEGKALDMMEEMAAPSGSKAPVLASEKAIMIVGVQNGTATITVTTVDGKATPAVLELRVVDVDGDRVITTADVTALYNYLLGGDEAYTATSDTDGDGNITAADITVLYNLLLGN